MITVDSQIEVNEADDVRRRLSNTGHVRRAMADVLDESARLGAQSAGIYAPKDSRRTLRAISSQRATLGFGGALQASAGVAAVGAQGLPAAASEEYPFMVHEGTGIYGALNRLIRPKRARAMVFVGRTGLVRAATVRGQRAQPFIGEAYEDVNAYLPQRLDEMVRRILETDS